MLCLVKKMLLIFKQVLFAVLSKLLGKTVLVCLGRTVFGLSGKNSFWPVWGEQFLGCLETAFLPWEYFLMVYSSLSYVYVHLERKELCLMNKDVNKLFRNNTNTFINKMYSIVLLCTLICFLDLLSCLLS